MTNIYLEKIAEQKETSTNYVGGAAALTAGAGLGVWGSNAYERSKPVTTYSYNNVTGERFSKKSGAPTVSGVAKTMVNDVKNPVVSGAKSVSSKVGVDYRALARKVAGSALSKKITPLAK